MPLRSLDFGGAAFVSADETVYDIGQLWKIPTAICSERARLPSDAFLAILGMRGPASIDK
jgi:hypothetical protein